MIQINLLDWRIKKQRAHLRNLSVIIISFSFITTMSAAYLLHSIKALNQTVQSDITQHQHAIQNMTSKINLIKNQLDKLEWLQTQNKKLLQLTNDKHTITQFLTSLSQEIPNQLWLTKLLHNEKQLILEGHALSYASIADFVSQLKHHPLSQHLKIAHINQPHSAPYLQSYLSFRLEGK